MKIFHISDTHVGSKKSFNRDALDHVIRELKRGDYELLVHAGDVTQSGDFEYYREAKKILDKVEVPYIVIPGNHDKRNGGFSFFEDFFDSPNGIKEFDDSIVIHVDSAVPDSDEGRVGIIKFEMIKEALEEYQRKALKIIAIHHHVLPVPQAGRERNVLSNAGDLLELFLKSDVDLVLCGHRHTPNVHRVENTVIVNAGTVSGRKTRHGDVNSYNVIEVEENEISVRTFRIDNSRSVERFSRGEQRLFHDFGDRQLRIVHAANTFISGLAKTLLPNTTSFRYTSFSNAVDTINDLDADLIVHCGGVVEEGISRNYKLADKYLSRLEVPVVYTPSGRDINYLGYELFQDICGELDQSYSDENVFLRGISSAQYDSSVGIVGETERRKLFEMIGEREETFKGLFLHHNVIPIPHSREKGLLEDGGYLLRKAVDEGIDLILTGTSSHPFAARVGGTVVVNANSLSSVYQRSRYGNSFNVVDIYENMIVVSEISSLWGNRRLLGMWARRKDD